jgi:hypothetical protein
MKILGQNLQRLRLRKIKKKFIKSFRRSYRILKGRLVLINSKLVNWNYW